MNQTDHFLHDIYLPFTEKQLTKHFADIRKGSKIEKTCEKQVEYFIKSLERYKKFPANDERKGKNLEVLRTPCQTEKDEKFWTASCLMTVFYSENRTTELARLFAKAYGVAPPIRGIPSWQDCFSGDLHLFFEPNLPSPRSYKEWLRENLTNRHFIPYILDSAYEKKNLEGATNVDAMIINADNNFAVLIEAKVLSDISYQITYDVMRNQIARNIDVILENNIDLTDPLNKRDSGRSLFLLLTPAIFKENPDSRLYGYKMNEYKSDPDKLGQDLSHRINYDWKDISKRIGWLTWEDFKEINEKCCMWL